MKKCLGKVSVLFSVIALVVAFSVIVKDIKNIKYYDMDARTAITECTDFENAIMSFERTRYSPDGKLQSRNITYTFLCGIQQAKTIEIKADGIQIINFDKNFGDAKIVFENHDEEKIYSFALVEGDNKFEMEKGTYDIYIIGKYFFGKLGFTVSET